MKYFQKITLCLAAIVVMALGNKAVAAITVEGEDATQHLLAGGLVTVNDVDSNTNGGAVVFTNNTSTANLDIVAGIVQVGAASKVLPTDVGTLAGLLPSGNTTVENGAILEITAATANCIAGDVEVKLGGILQVDDNIPASGGPFATGADLTVHSGAVIKLGAGITWAKDINVVA